jgi:FkbM family methyltransferase
MEQHLTSILKTHLSRKVSNPFWLKSGALVYIYGTGSVARDTQQALVYGGIPVTAFIDHYKREFDSLAGLPILEPDALSIREKKRAILVLAIHNRDVDMQALTEHLRALGYTIFISMIEVFDHFGAELGQRYWLTRRSYYGDFEERIQAAGQLLTDVPSQALYASILEFRMTGDFSVLPRPDPTTQYLPSDLPQWKQPTRLVDCGAYDGDVIRDFITHGCTFSALSAFEPDLQNYTRLVENMRKYACTIPELSLWPCGVHASSRQLSFASGLGEASGIADSGGRMIQCVALDEALPNFAPTLIKMDIEGAEKEALAGAEKLIASSHPGLAICTYHSPDHLWEIPLLINTFADKYKIQYQYFLRTYAYNSFETVFYAIPTQGNS